MLLLIQIVFIFQETFEAFTKMNSEYCLPLLSSHFLIFTMNYTVKWLVVKELVLIGFFLVLFILLLLTTSLTKLCIYRALRLVDQLLNKIKDSSQGKSEKKQFNKIINRFSFLCKIKSKQRCIYKCLLDWVKTRFKRHLLKDKLRNGFCDEHTINHSYSRCF